LHPFRPPILVPPEDFHPLLFNLEETRPHPFPGCVLIKIQNQAEWCGVRQKVLGKALVLRFPAFALLLQSIPSFARN